MTQRNARIDLLRGIAILAVLLLHFNLTYRLNASPLATWLPAGLLDALLWNGNYGVTMFFAISGFLITDHALRRWGSPAAVAPGAFYLRRAARILPPLLLALVLIVALAWAGLPSFGNGDGGAGLPLGYFWVAIPSVLTFWHNVLMQDAGYFNYALNVYWSLSVEEMFYLGFPLACLLLRRRRWLLAASLVLVAVGPWYRARHAGNEIFYMYGYWACFDAIALGIAAAVLAPALRLPARAGLALQWAAAGLIGFSFWRGIGGNEVWGFSQVAAGTAVLLLFAPVDGPAGRWLGSLPARGLRWMGRHSYELYLFHIVVLGILRDYLPRAAVAPEIKLVLLLGYLAVSLLVAGLVARGFAEPANRWLRRRVGGAITMQPI